MKQAGELWDKVRSIFAGYPEWVSEGLVGIFAGLVVGFLSRVLGRTVLIVLGTAFLVGVGLHYFGIVSFNTTPLLQFLGISQWPAPSVCLSSIFEWGKTHFVACIAIIIGFIFGWKLGH